jgi:hypothetical protein
MKFPAAAAAVLFAIFIATPVWAGTPARSYASVPAFLKSLPEIESSESDGVWGELSVKGQKDWAGVVYFHEDLMRYRQIVVLSKGSDGRYRLVSDTKPQGAHGGTGNHYIDEVSISMRSLFISSSWNWHGCAGSATHQYRHDKGQWRLIGANFRRHNVLKGEDGDIGDIKDEAAIDVNLLTGDVEVLFTPHLKEPEVIRAKIRQEKMLLKDYADHDGMPERFQSYADC